VVIGSDKQPIELKDGKIRATYGHSFPVDLGLEPVQPPPQLYNGTARDLAQSILRVGLKPRDRQYVHLSSSVNEAVVGHGIHYDDRGGPFVSYREHFR
jgi:putative RNA 2'-phosphotransferase